MPSMPTTKSRLLVLPLALVFACCTPFGASFLGAAAPQTQPGAAAQEMPLAEGKELYQAFCAACHGRTGVGDGPVAAEMKKPTPDLTRLAERNHGKFPSAQVEAAVKNEDGRIAHGTAEMPLWGPVFGRYTGDGPEGRGKLEVLKESGVTGETLAKIRIQELVEYIDSIQGHKQQ